MMKGYKMAFNLPITLVWIVLMFSSCFTVKTTKFTSNRTVQNDTSFLLRIDTSIVSDKTMLSMLGPYKVKFESSMSKVIGYSKNPLTKAQPESTLGNLIADAQLRRIKKEDDKVHLSVTNQGGIRIPYIPPGAITLEKAYEVMPFDNLLTVIEIPGDKLIELCNHISTKGGWPISGLSFIIRDNKAENILVQGNPLNTNLTYKLVTSDYLANGGDNCDFLKGLKRKNYNILLRDAIIQLISESSEQQPLNIQIENRINYAE